MLEGQGCARDPVAALGWLLAAAHQNHAEAQALAGWCYHTGNGARAELEKAFRVADFLELGELMIDDALDRKESCGGHFRLESQTEEGEALRDDENYAYAAAWEYKGDNQPEVLHKEELVFENVKLSQRSYK